MLIYYLSTEKAEAFVFHPDTLHVIRIRKTTRELYISYFSHKS